MGLAHAEMKNWLTIRDQKATLSPASWVEDLHI